MEDVLKKLIERRHPLYEEMAEHWNFAESTYEGGRSWFAANIFQYVKEGPEEFAKRVQRAYRFNHTREVVDLVNKYLFKMDVVRREKEAPAAVKKFWAKATRDGLDIHSQAKQISKLSSIFGRPWIVVDSTFRPRLAENGTPILPVSRADAQRANAEVYSYIVRPQQVLDMSYDESGGLNWILIHEVARDDADPKTSSGNLINRFRLWTRNDWTLYEARRERRKVVVVEVDSGVHGLGQVPVFPADNTPSDEKYAAPGLIDDIAYLDRAVANYLSNLDAIIQDQTFSQLAMPAQGLLPGEDGHAKLVEMGTKRIFTFDGEAKTAPYYLTPDVKQAELIMSTILKIINEIYHSVGLSGERTKDDNGGGIDNASGVAKGYDFERTNSLLVSKADSLERVENKLVELVCLWAGEDVPEDALVRYPDNFDTRGLYDEFEIGARLTLLNAPDGVRREQMKLLIKKLFPALGSEDLDKLYNELKDWPIDPLEVAGKLGQAPGTAVGPVKAAGAQRVAKEMAA